MTLILQENVSLRTGRAEDTLDFFEGEVDRLSAELDRLSQRMMAFKTENETALPDSLAFRRSQQATLQERLLQLEREETGLQDERDRMVEFYERTGRTLNAAPGHPRGAGARGAAPASSPGRRRSIRATNPNIRLLETRIAALERIVAEQRARARRHRGHVRVRHRSSPRSTGGSSSSPRRGPASRPSSPRSTPRSQATPANELAARRDAARLRQRARPVQRRRRRAWPPPRSASGSR